MLCSSSSTVIPKLLFLHFSTSFSVTCEDVIFTTAVSIFTSGEARHDLELVFRARSSTAAPADKKDPQQSLSLP